jgi:hypothetical protein
MNNTRDARRPLKAKFDAHQDGMAGLKAGDYEAFGIAIRRERLIIQEQADSFADTETATAESISLPIDQACKRSHPVIGLRSGPSRTHRRSSAFHGQRGG